VDKNIVVQVFGFARGSAHKTDIVFEPFHFVQHHAAADAALQGGLLVMGKLHASIVPQQGKARARFDLQR
jgi:hypothetical protein